MTEPANPRQRSRTKANDPVRFARNAALVSGVAAAAVIATSLAEGDVVLLVLGIIALWFAVGGVAIWARRERHRAESAPDE